MPGKSLHYEVQLPIEKCKLMLTRVIEDLSKGKTLANLFEFKDQFKNSGSWWIRAKDEKSGKYRLMWKWFPYKTVYISITISPMTNGNTFVVAESKIFALFGLLDVLEKPLVVFKESLDAKIASGF